MYCQINDSEKLKKLMVLIGKNKVIPAFEENIGIPWKEAKMSKFYACGLGHKEDHKKGVLYYMDGKYKYGTHVIDCPLDFILECK